LNRLTYILIFIFLVTELSARKDSLKYSEKDSSYQLQSLYLNFKKDIFRFTDGNYSNRKGRLCSDSAYFFLKKGKYDIALQLLKKSDTYDTADLILKNWNTGLRGIIYYRKNNFKKALKNLNKSVAYFKNEKHNYLTDYASALFYQFRGRTLADIGLYSSAAESYITSNKFFLGLGNKSKVFENYKFIGRVYQKNGINENLKFAEQNYYLALSGFKKIGKIDETAWVYLILSDFFIEQNKPDTALSYTDSCYITAFTYNDRELIPISLNNYGEIYLKQGKLKKAEEKFTEAVKIYKHNKNIKNRQITYYNLSKLFFKRKETEKASAYIDSAIYLAEKNSNELNLLKFYLYKKDLYVYLKKDVSALFNKYLNLNDKIIKDKQQNTIYAYQEFFKTETLAKEKEMLEIKSKRKDEKIFSLFVIIILSIIVFTAVSLLILMLKKRKEERLKDKLRDLQLQSVQSGMLPHLLFNTSTAAGSLIFKEKREIAYDYLVKMSQLMRKVITDTGRLYKTLKEEIEFVENYLELQKIRFKERFNYSLEIDKDIDLNIEVPQMILQTYVENAVKYGVEPLKEGGLIKIRITKTDEIIQLITEDNGTGKEAAKKMTYKGTGSGIKMMSKIYKIHNSAGNKTIISFKSEDLYKIGAKGTRVTVTIKQNKYGKK